MRTLDVPYGVGVFAAAGDLQRAADVCGDRGVYFGYADCGEVAIAACEDGSAGTGSRSCIYLGADRSDRRYGRPTSSAGHYVDSSGRCWDLVGADITFDEPDRLGLSGVQSGRFEVIAVADAGQTKLAGAFVACLAFVDRSTCE